MPSVEEEIFLIGGIFILYKCINKYIDKYIIVLYNCVEVVNHGY